MHMVDDLDKLFSLQLVHMGTEDNQTIKYVVDSIDTNREDAADCHGVKHVSQQRGSVLVCGEGNADDRDKMSESEKAKEGADEGCLHVDCNELLLL